MKAILTTFLLLIIFINANAADQPGKLKLTLEKKEKGIKLAIYKKQNSANQKNHQLAEKQKVKATGQENIQPVITEELVLEKRVEAGKLN